MEWLYMVGALIVAYLIGSISTAILVGKALKGNDIRDFGSKNAGATNALRTYGKKAALMVVLGDALKAVVALSLGILIANISSLQTDAFIYLSGIGVVLGHNFPLYFKFRGGKGVLVSAVAMMFADVRVGIIVLIIAIGIMALTRYVSLGSVVGAVLFFVLGVVLNPGDLYFAIFAFIMSGLVIFMHRQNIKRLLSGTENKLGQKKE